MGIESFVVEKVFGAIWKKAASLWKYKISWRWREKKLIGLSEEKYRLEKEKIEKGIPIQDAEKKEQAGLKGLRHSSPLARELLSLYLDAAKRKIGLRNEIDISIIFQGKRLNGKNIVFLYERAKEAAKLETDYLKSEMKKIYQECHANNLLATDEPKIDDSVQELLKELMTNMLIRKETF